MMRRTAMVWVWGMVAAAAACADDPTSEPSSPDAGVPQPPDAHADAGEPAAHPAPEPLPEPQPQPDAGIPLPTERCTPVPVGSGQAPLIDDFEDGDEQVTVIDGRVGGHSWWVSAGGTVELSHVSGGAPGSTRAMRFSGSTPEQYGAGWSVFLNQASDVPCSFDASKYRGVSFWARAERNLPALSLLLDVGADQRCYQVEEWWACNDYYVGTVNLDSTWRRYELTWQQFPGFGAASQSPSDALGTIFNLYSLQFKPDANPTDFAFDVDDVEFLVGSCGTGVCDPANPCPVDCCGDQVCEPFEYGSGLISGGSTGNSRYGATPVYCAADCPIEHGCPTHDLGSAVPQIVTGNTALASDDFVPSCLQQGTPPAGQGPEVEYTFTAPAAGRFRFQATAADFEPTLVVLNGSCAGSELACAPPGDGSITSGSSALAVDLSSGQTVTLLVERDTGSAGPFTLELTQLRGACPDQDLGSALPVALSGTTAGAENSLVPSCGDAEAPDYTFAWSAPAAGYYAFDVTSPSLDTVLELRNGSCSGPELACNDDASFLSTGSHVLTSLAAGQTVAINVEGKGAAGAFDLAIHAFACPAVDLGSALPVAEADAVLGAIDGLSPCGSTGGPDTSFVWTAPATGAYTFAVSAQFSTRLGLLQGASCEGSTLACSPFFAENSSVSAALQMGESVVIVVDSAAGASGSFDLNIAALPCPFADLGDQLPLTTSGSLPSEALYLDASTCLADTPADLTFTWTAPAAGSYAFDTIGSNFDTVLSLLNGAGCGGTPTACDDDTIGAQSRIVQTLTEGQTVTLVLDSWNPEGGNYTLNISAL